MTAAELVAVWARRRDRYELTHRYGLTQEEMVAVMAWRRMEIDALPALERASAYKQWATWLPS